MNLDAKVEAAEFMRALTAYRETIGISMPDAIKKQGKFLLQKVAQFTPPKTIGQGKKAVARDIKQAIYPISPRNFKSPELRKAISKAIRERNLHDIEVILRSAGWGRLEKVVDFSADIHTQQRNKRGRVPHRQGVKFATPDVQQVNDYIKRVQNRVGMAKGGFSLGIAQLGGSIPAWVAKWTKAGEFKDNTSSAVDTYIRQINKSPWTEQGDEDRVVANAVTSRTQIIFSDINRRLEAAKQKAGLN